MGKIILITNDESVSLKVKEVATSHNHEFMSYTEDEWATFDEIDEYIQDGDMLPKKVFALPFGKNSFQSLEDMEAKTILKVINDVNGNAVKAAKTLKIGRATLYRKLDKYGINLKQMRKTQFSKKSETKVPLSIVKKAS
ncbi:MAG: helix-turn-helix domain-containing protein [Bdellovibrionales bacterium]